MHDDGDGDGDGDGEGEEEEEDDDDGGDKIDEDCRVHATQCKACPLCDNKVLSSTVYIGYPLLSNSPLP